MKHGEVKYYGLLSCWLWIYNDKVAELKAETRLKALLEVNGRVTMGQWPKALLEAYPGL